MGLTGCGVWSQASVLRGVYFSFGFCLIFGGKSWTQAQSSSVLVLEPLLLRSRKVEEGCVFVGMCEGQWGSHSWAKQCIQNWFILHFSCTISDKNTFQHHFCDVVWVNKTNSLREGCVIYALSIFQHFKTANLRTLFTAFTDIKNISVMMTLLLFSTGCWVCHNRTHVSFWQKGLGLLKRHQMPRFYSQQHRVLSPSPLASSGSEIKATLTSEVHHTKYTQFWWAVSVLSHVGCHRPGSQLLDSFQLHLCLEQYEFIQVKSLALHSVLLLISRNCHKDFC